jgi:hypothetical protein
MVRRWQRGAAAMLGTFLAAHVCEAQSTLPAVYVQAGPALGVHLEGEQYHRASPPLEGATVGAALSVGGRLGPQLGVEAQVTVDGKQSAPQADVYFTRTDYTAESRDVLLDVNLRFRPRGGSHLEFTAGAGWAYTRFARRDVVFSSPLPPTTTEGPDIETSMWQPTLNGTIAVPFTVSPRVELVPSVGIRWTRRPLDTEAWYFGVGRFTVIAGLAVRLRS